MQWFPAERCGGTGGTNGTESAQIQRQGHGPAVALHSAEANLPGLLGTGQAGQHSGPAVGPLGVMEDALQAQGGVGDEQAAIHDAQADPTKVRLGSHVADFHAGGSAAGQLDKFPDGAHVAVAAIAFDAELMLQDAGQAAFFIGLLGGFAVLAPVVAVNQLVGVGLGSDTGIHQRPRTGEEGAVLVALALAVKAVGRSATEDGHAVADDGDEGHGAQRHAMAKLRGDDRRQVAVQIGPVGLPLLLWQVGRVAQGELSKAGCVSALLERGADGAQ
ncbi:MAG: hypothetical protein EBV32_05705 [Proteobacteria bacterium]|uniref:Uncharacterized protein n=1 Tax=Candidatus Fonsibacter lacus TaxID=2576439 RepID=A0A964XSA9_9PROT|nr:hypothetical protein [Candidatus Fonsibacter lacus]